MSSTDSSPPVFQKASRGAAGPLVALLWIVVVVGIALVPKFYPPDGAERAVTAQFIGRFHPLIVHFPIALLLLVPLLEAAGMFRRSEHLRDSAGFVLWLSTAGTVASTIFGWILGFSGGYSGELVNQHMWSGVILALGCLALLFLRRLFVERGWWSLGVLYVPALLASIALMSWTAHQGGQLTHGESYLVEHMPGSMRTWVGLPPKPARTPKKSTTTSTATSSGAADVKGVEIPNINVVVNAKVLVEKDGSFYEERIAPAFDRTCVTCHNANKKKAKLRLDSYEAIMAGSENGAVIKPGDLADSELYRRITLPHDDEEFMPSDGKKPLTADETKWVELWIAGGASATAPISAFAGAPAPPRVIESVAWAPDFHPHLDTISSLEKKLGVRLVPRSQLATDGVILRTASAPARCDDAALAALSPLAELIVDAELARTKTTDAGLKSIASWKNLRRLDLTQTDVTSAGVTALDALKKLESLNLTATRVDGAAVEPFRAREGLKVYIEHTAAAPVEKSDR